MIDRSAIEKLEDMALEGAKVQVVDGRPYSATKLVPVTPPLPTPMTAHTLGAIRDYLQENPDELNMAEVLVQVVDPSQVEVLSRLASPYQQRATYLVSRIIIDRFPFGRFMGLEDFIIGLQAQFEPSDEVKNLLSVVGNLDDGKVSEFSDDGVSQTVNTKFGITKKAQITLEPIVELAPYRSFPEVIQPASRFALRMRSDNPTPKCALFEADGGAWRVAAIKNIVEWLQEALPEGMTILA